MCTWNVSKNDITKSNSVSSKIQHITVILKEPITIFPHGRTGYSVRMFLLASRGDHDFFHLVATIPQADQILHLPSARYLARCLLIIAVLKSPHMKLLR